MDHDYGWEGKLVRNKDGRTGKISLEDGWGPLLTLNIAVDDGSSAQVKLRSGAFDGGEEGWEWFCENYEGGEPRWLKLG